MDQQRQLAVLLLDVVLSGLERQVEVLVRVELEARQDALHLARFRSVVKVLFRYLRPWLCKLYGVSCTYLHSAFFEKRELSEKRI